MVKTISRTVPARRWQQINGILANHAPGTTQGYVLIEQVRRQQPVPGLRRRQRRRGAGAAERRRGLSARAEIDRCTSRLWRHIQTR